MNKVEIVEKLALVAEISKTDAKKYLESVIDVFTSELVEGGEINLIGFGKFYTTEVPERKGIVQLGSNKGDEYVTPAHIKPCFKFGKPVKDLVR